MNPNIENNSSSSQSCCECTFAILASSPTKSVVKSLTKRRDNGGRGVVGPQGPIRLVSPPEGDLISAPCYNVRNTSNRIFI